MEGMTTRLGDDGHQVMTRKELVTEKEQGDTDAQEQPRR